MGLARGGDRLGHACLLRQEGIRCLRLGHAHSLRCEGDKVAMTGAWALCWESLPVAMEAGADVWGERL